MNSSQALLRENLRCLKNSLRVIDTRTGVFSSTTELPGEKSKLSVYNRAQVYIPSEKALAQRILEESDADEDEPDAATLSEEVAKAVLKVVWRKGNYGVGAWHACVFCPLEIVGRVIGSGDSFRFELEAAYPDLKISLSQEEFSKDARKQLYLEKSKLSQGATSINLVHPNNKIAVAQAWIELNAKVQEKIKFAPYTHFISLPILLQDNHTVYAAGDKFYKSVNQLGAVKNTKAFVPAGLYHYTLVMLRLYDDETLEKTIKAMESLRNRSSAILFSDEIPANLRHLVVDEKSIAMPGKGLRVNLKGCFVMDENPREARVVFTKERLTKGISHADATNVDGTTNLELLDSAVAGSIREEPDPYFRLRIPAETYIEWLVSDLVEELLNADVITMDDVVADRLVSDNGKYKRKLHVSLINARLGDGEPYDATPIISDKSLANFDFGEAVITGLHISCRGQAAPDTSYYTPLYVLPIRPLRGL